MKNSIFLLLAIAMLAFSCDDDEPTPMPPAGPEEKEVMLTVDFDGLINNALPNSEVSAYVNFGQPSGTPNSEFTTESVLGDTISWNLNTGASTDVILFNGIDIIDSIAFFDDYFVEVSDTIPSANYRIEVINNEQDALELKYDLWFFVERNGVQTGPYYIDPKIRIGGR